MMVLKEGKIDQEDFSSSEGDFIADEINEVEQIKSFIREEARGTVRRDQDLDDGFNIVI